MMVVHQTSADSRPKFVGLVWGLAAMHPALSLHSSHEPGELSQWLYKPWCQHHQYHHAGLLYTTFCCKGTLRNRVCRLCCMLYIFVVEYLCTRVLSAMDSVMNCFCVYLRPISMCGICCGFVVQQIHNKSHRWSLTVSDAEYKFSSVLQAEFFPVK